MATTTFDLPDLGEGLAEAEIVTWHVKEGDTVESDAPLVSVETAKAVVDVPSPHAGRIVKLHAAEGDVVAVHSALVDFDVDGAGTEAAGPEQAGTARRPSNAGKAAAVGKQQTDASERVREDSGTVVGAVPSGGDDLEEQVIIRRRGSGSRVAPPKAAPAARARAKALGVDLHAVAASGHRGQITPGDVERHAARGAVAPPARTHKAVRFGQAEPLRGPRRAMAQSMSAARDAVMPTSLFDDADVHGWQAGEDVTVRVVRALVAGCGAEPALNAWFDSEALARTLLEQVDLALAVDTPDGLIVPVIRGVDAMPAPVLRRELDRVKQATRERTIAPQDMRNATITLSNFGMMAGRYASPVIVPPQVAIVGTGGIRHDVVPVLGAIEVHRRIPLSLTFDHRCVTGGEACRFLAAMIEDLQRPT